MIYLKYMESLSIFNWSSSSRYKQFSNNVYKCSQCMYETCNDFLMKVYMASFTKFMNTWKFKCNFEWMKIVNMKKVYWLMCSCYEKLKICTFYKVTRTSSFIPFDMKRCNAFMKGYLLKNVQKPKEKLHWFARNRFWHRKNPVLSER